MLASTGRLGIISTHEITQSVDEGALSFEKRIPIIEEQIKRRRFRWNLHTIPFEDVVQIVTIHAFQKYHTFDPSKGPFLKWINRLITRQMSNLLRNHYSKWQRPCIRCAFNTGDGSCSKTSSRTQCNECKLYRNWKRRKGEQFNVQQTLPLDNHSQEVENEQGDFFDVAAAKEVIDAKMKERLSKFDWQVYSMLYIENKSEIEVGKVMKMRKIGKMPAGYLTILRLRHMFVDLTREIIEQEGLGQ